MTNWIIGTAGILLSILTYVAGWKTRQHKEGQETGQILSELGYLKSNTDEIKRRLDKQDERDREYISRLTSLESRLDIMERQIKGG